MKTTYKLMTLAATVALSLTSCSDFEEVNTDHSAAQASALSPDFSLNKSFYEAQMDPDIAERVFVYNWASVTRIVGDNTMGATARYNDEYNDRLYTYTSNWVKAASEAIKIAETIQPSNERQADFNNNIKQIARIWKVMLIADYTDSFGPFPLNAFQGVAPVFNSVEEVYNYFFVELKEASEALKLNVVPTDKEKIGDPAFEYNPTQWQKLANSLRLRYALRLSEVNKEKAKTEFEAAAKLPLLTAKADLFGFPENGGWSAYEGVLNRSWSDHCISSTMVNLLTGLGGVKVKEYREKLEKYTKPMNYLGIKFDKHFPETTDNPTKQMWLDGIPEVLDPRALEVWVLTNDTDAKNWPSQADQGQKNHNKYGMLNPKNEKDTLVKVDAQFTWNGYPAGTSSDWSPKTFKYNDVMAHPASTTPMLSQTYRNNSLKRIWMSPWETYFLLAEGAVYGWSTPVSAKDAYENGVKASFEYFGLSEYVNDYLASESYNRVGTSVKFDHTTEPTDFEADYVDGYTKEAKKMTYKYPDANKVLYKGKKLNDQLTKIITQKYIANTPYGVVEIWNDHRRLGLPFWEIPANETDALTGSDMDGLYKVADWKNGQKWYHYTQRMRYPAVFEGSDKEQYNNALQLLGGKNTMMVPLWWAIK